MSAPPVVNVTGERVALGPLRRELIPVYQRWFNDFATDRTQGDLPGPRTLERATRWYERNATAEGAIWFTIYEIETWQPIGATWLSDIDDRNGTAYYGISIGETTARGKGRGTETTRLMLELAFSQLGLDNVALDVFENNPAGVRAYEKAGFREYGRIREAYVSGGRRWDGIMMEATREKAMPAGRTLANVAAYPAGSGSPVISVAGVLVALGPVAREQIALHMRWLNDFGTLRTLGSLPVPRTREAIEALYQATIVERDDIVFFTVYDRSTLQPIGYSTLQDIDWRNGTAELTLSIGEPMFRGSGYGTEVTRLILEHAFGGLELHNVALRCYAHNLAGLRAYEKAGFREFARIRDGFALGRLRVDVILMEAVRPDAGTSR